MSYDELSTKHELQQMGVDIFEPLDETEVKMAHLFEDFSSFVLKEEMELCQQILDDESSSSSVGLLQGGNESFSIYRVSFPVGVECAEEIVDAPSSRRKLFYENAVVRLLQAFHEHRKLYRNSLELSISTIKQYMLRMCARRCRERGCNYNISELDNLMFILQFGGPTKGQVRHIDNMIPNIQICLYMSKNCPSTIVYAMDDSSCNAILNGRLLIEYWEDAYSDPVPELLKDVLENYSKVKLESKWFTKFFKYWKSIDNHLNCFGKLYQPVSHQLALHTTEPGTTLLAGGNEVHAGPPTMESRMFAFAVGIPELYIDGDIDYTENFENDGEVQYSPALLHVDFCTLLFGILDYEYSSAPSDEKSVHESKHFLLNILVKMIKEVPMRCW